MKNIVLGRNFNSSELERFYEDKIINPFPRAVKINTIIHHSSILLRI